LTDERGEKSRGGLVGPEKREGGGGNTESLACVSEGKAVGTKMINPIDLPPLCFNAHKKQKKAVIRLAAFQDFQLPARICLLSWKRRSGRKEKRLAKKIKA